LACYGRLGSVGSLGIAGEFDLPGEVTVAVTVTDAVVVYPTTDTVVEGGTLKVLVRGNSPRHEQADM
jgi:hypothetical protein